MIAKVTSFYYQLKCFIPQFEKAFVGSTSLSVKGIKEGAKVDDQSQLAAKISSKMKATILAPIFLVAIVAIVTTPVSAEGELL